MLSIVCVVKAGTFIIWQKSWRSLFNYVSPIEKCQLKKRDHFTNEIIKKYIKYSRKITYFYWALVAATVFCLILAPLAFYLSSFQSRETFESDDTPFPEIMSSWAPFDKTKGWGYWIITLIQSIIYCYGGGIVANYDSNAVVLMSFFSGQLEILKVNCERLFGNGEEIISYEEAVKRIRMCYHQHLFLTKWYYKFAANMDWHSHNVLYMSLKADEGVYSSAWWSQGVRVRRSVALLAGQLNKNIMLTAEPFTSIATFMAILKGSYSYYTLLIR